MHGVYKRTQVSEEFHKEPLHTPLHVKQEK